MMKNGSFLRWMLVLSVGITFLPIRSESAVKKLPFNKVVIWGHKLHSHTHSYIHWAFYRTFKHLGYDTYWFDNKDNIDAIDFSNSLFITEGSVDQEMPIRDDCRYILHNCKMGKYERINQLGNCITLQVYTHDCRSRDVQEIEDFVLIDIHDRCIYMPWATDLLPHEIDKIKEQLPDVKKEQISYFVGSMWGGVLWE